jgi:hypothetical protein
MGTSAYPNEAADIGGLDTDTDSENFFRLKEQRSREPATVS